MEYATENGFGYFEDLVTKSEEAVETLRENARDLIKLLPDYSDENVVKVYEEFMDRYINSFVVGIITFVYESIVSEKLSESLRERYENVTEILGQLLKSDFQSFITASDGKLGEIKESDLAPQEIDDYLHNYFYINASYHYVEPISREEVIQMAKNHSSRGSNPEENLELSVDLTKEEEVKVQLLRLSEVLRDYRKEINLIGSYTMSRFIDEICKRKDLNIDQVEKLLWFEYPRALNEGESFKIDERERFSLILDTEQELHFLPYDAFEVGVNEVQELKGTPACRGEAEGEVSVVLAKKDFPKFKEGQILVTTMTRPEFLPIMKKAAAIVTDEGGLTSHAAIVARELGIPCIVGVGSGTSVLKDGDLVRVDANKGVVDMVTIN